MSALLPNPYLNAAAVEAMLYKGIVAPSGVALAERDAGVLLRSYRFYGHLPEKCMADELRLQALLHRANLHTMQQGVQRQQQLVDALEGARTLAEAGKLTPAMMQAVGETRVRQMTTGWFPPFSRVCRELFQERPCAAGSLPAALQLSQTKRAATLRAQDLQSFIDWADREFAQQGRSDRRILLRHAVRPGDDTTTTAARVLGVTGQGMRERFKGLPQVSVSALLRSVSFVP